MYIQTAKWSGIVSASMFALHLTAAGVNYTEGKITEALNATQRNVVQTVATHFNLEPIRPQEQELKAATAEELVSLACSLEGVNPALGRAVMFQESNKKPLAISVKGAIGLMQVMPQNAEFCGLRPEELFIPQKNARCGCKILRYEISAFGLDDGLRAYNAGRPNMHKRFRETEAYVPSVKQRYLTEGTKELLQKPLV